MEREREREREREGGRGVREKREAFSQNHANLFSETALSRSRAAKRMAHILLTYSNVHLHSTHAAHTVERDNPGSVLFPNAHESRVTHIPRLIIRFISSDWSRSHAHQFRLITARDIFIALSPESFHRHHSGGSPGSRQ